MNFSRRTVTLALVLGIVMFFALQGCASLQPLPRFRTSSISFAPDQLPLAQRSASDLMDPSKIGAYSLVKEEAMQKNHPLVPADEIRQMVINQSSSRTTMYVDKVGLDSEELEDELAANEEFSTEEPPVDEAVMQRVLNRTFTSAERLNMEEENAAVNRVEMVKEIVNLLGVRYQYGGIDAVRGLDCSAFTGTIYSRAFGVSIPRSSGLQFQVGTNIKKDNLKVGDLVFFKTRRRRAPVSHVGIYVGENLFAHASTKHGVIISPLDAGYYDRTFVGARRVLNAELSDASALRR